MTERFTVEYERGNEPIFKDNGKPLTAKEVIHLLNLYSKALSLAEYQLKVQDRTIREYEEDEKKYANEIVRLNKEVKDKELLRLGNEY